ncbi:isoquinoline 1-oxidoreductase alpha subunit [Maribacter vaceletii]|uniref:Isoquinoline 1-oxidoreductase alpha subunit n=1 Tax=Maribacter vaceletii TaxID=1206816 RepID=A0A495E6K2_9FLAO|nr:(2Fe-2S)-binding protein [Maribacter vaceletii]RKR12189.1 isoquinoline 1-oxidoreductase alpha subunit [Maribacter vaceletii]
MITLKINGKEHSVDVDPTMPLLWVIRDIIGFTGTKFGCGKGLCGACMVLMDGNAINSCQMPISAIQGKEIVTIEGKTENLQALQKSWAEFNVPQCGFCQSGQLITATSMLNNNPNPSEDEVNGNMSRNICRCGTYTRIKEAITHCVELKNKG